MSLFKIAEIFGHGVNHNTAQARIDRTKKWCRFRNSPCTKGSKTNPTGVCSLVRDNHLACLCPVRFAQDQRIFENVGRLAFGGGRRILAVPELSILRVTKTTPSGETRTTRVGKIDYLIALLDNAGEPIDFAALEVQAVYFSGGALQPAFRQFITTGKLPADSERRPDWRSSAQKRLMPQLSLKVPVFRRWGKKFFVAVDSHFFAAMPPMKEVQSLDNSEITWLVYPFQKAASEYDIGQSSVHFTLWDDVLTVLREGTAPQPSEILADIKRKTRKSGITLTT